MIGRGGFVARFLLVFAGLVALGWLTGAPRAYTTALRVAGAATCPLVNGWTLEDRTASGARQAIYFRKGTDQLRLALGLDQLALGLLPLFALLGATPGLGARRLAASAAIGGAALFALDLVILLVYPWLVGNPNPVTDILGTFLGLLTFVGGPLILWFVLTYGHLRDVWKLDRRRVAR